MVRSIIDLFKGLVALVIGLSAIVLVVASTRSTVGNSIDSTNSNMAAQPSATETPHLDSSAAWQNVIQTQLAAGPTIAPTSVIFTILNATTEVPTLPGNFTVLTPTPTRFVPAGSTYIPPTPAPSPIPIEIRKNTNPRQGEFSPPPALAPLSMNINDHYYFMRPVDASAISKEISWYVYGSDGPQNDWRVHHGIDLPNPKGKEVRAAGAGRVVWASDNYRWKRPDGLWDTAYTYGNVVIIEHDFSYKGQKLYTLYAHLLTIMPNLLNKHVEMGDIIGLSGESGVVTGPHVHFEVRVGENYYYTTRNPILWMVPFEGHGVIAGRLLHPNGQPVEDQTVYLYNKDGRFVDSTTTYVNPKIPGRVHWNPVSDDYWHENFVFGDVSTGEYTVVTIYKGKQLSQKITIQAGTTAFVDFGQSDSKLLGASK